MALIDNKYIESLILFDSTVSAATAISQEIAGRPSPTSAHYYASVLFTRLCTNGVSLLYIAPRSRLVNSEFEHWDFASIASLVRNLIECYLTFYYLCVDTIAQDEWDCRWNLFNLHDCQRRRKLFEHFGSSQEELATWDEQAKDLKERLTSNPFFCSLNRQLQADCLKAKKAFTLSRDDLIARMGLNVSKIRGYYLFLSSQVHSYPLGFYRTGEGGRGRGIENDVEKRYIEWALTSAKFFLQRALKEMISLFPGSESCLSAQGREALFVLPEDDLGITRTSCGQE